MLVKDFFTEILLEIETLFVSYTNHFLNLYGVHSFETVPLCVTFFEGTTKSLIVFFPVSYTQRTIHRTNVEVTIKRLSETRWSAYYEDFKYF